MESNRRFELPSDVMEEEYVQPVMEQNELFSPLARKVMVFVSAVMLVLVVLAILVSYPLTLIPLAVILYAFHQYRKMKKNPYRKRSIFRRKKH